jgi:hypothetical protein
LAFGRKNTRKNPDDQQTTSISDPEKLLNSKGYLKSTTSSSGKKYQPKITQFNTKVPVEILNPEEIFEQTLSVEASTSKTTIKTEIDPYDTQNGLNKGSSSIHVIITSLSTPSSPETKVYVLINPKERTLYPDSSPASSPIYTSCKSEEVIPRFLFSPLLEFTPCNNKFLVFYSLQPEEVEQSPLQSLEVYKNPLFNSRSSSP